MEGKGGVCVSEELSVRIFCAGVVGAVCLVTSEINMCNYSALKMPGENIPIAALKCRWLDLFSGKKH